MTGGAVDPLTVCLRQPPLPLPGGEETPIADGDDIGKLGFLAPRKWGEVGRAKPETVRGSCLLPQVLEPGWRGPLEAYVAKRKEEIWSGEP